MPAWEFAAEINEIDVGGRKSVIVDDTPVLLLRDAAGYHCIEDLCTHDGQPLTEGEFAEGCITCPRHGARFDVATGAALCMPATEPVRTFPVETRPDGIFIGSGA
jgi:3-phenylpropionate/trans-cinnamate dioxygenase ferredoxin subunit